MARVLVVDDDPDIAKLVDMTLGAEGHDVVVANDGDRALALVGAGGFDAMILDLTMPGMDGFEVLTAMKADADPSVSSVPVILLTASGSPLDRIRGGIEGALFYLTKPFSSSDLQAHLGRALHAGAEGDQRRAAQRAALEQLARLEKGLEGAPQASPRPRLTRLDRPPERVPVAQDPPSLDDRAYSSLSVKQRQLLSVVAVTPTVQGAAERLGVSRSNVYASLRRIARRLSVPSVPELVSLARAGGVPTDEV